MAGFGDMLKGAQGMFTNPLFTAGASIYSGAPIGQSMQQAQRSQMMADQQREQAEQKAAWQKFSQGGEGIPQSIKPLLPFMTPSQGASAIASSAPKPVERPWWAGPNGQVDPAMLARTQAGRAVNNVNVSSGPQETAYDKEIGKQYAQYKIEGDKGAMTARRDLNNLNVMEKALEDPNLYTGTAAGTVQSVKKAAQSLFGLPVKGVASGELVQNLTKYVAVGLKDNLPGPLSDSDRRFLLELPPSLANTPEGNRRILGLGMLQKRYQIDRSRAASDYARQNGGRIDQGFDQALAGIEDQYAQKFSGMIAEMQGAGEMAPRSPMAGIPQLSFEDFQSAPSGTQFQAPDGSIRVKP